MLLAVDVGNTNVVFALYEGREIRARWRIATDPRRTGDEYAVWLLQLLEVEGVERSSVTRMIVSTVVPRARHNFEVLGEKYFGLVPLFAGEGAAEWNLPIDVDDPRSLGADRAVNAIGALLTIGAYPVWALSIMVVNALVIYGLTIHWDGE